MRVQRTFSRLGTGSRVYPNEADAFFDGWLKQGGITYLGINGRGVRYVVSHGDIYYNLDDAFEKLSGFHSPEKEIHSFCFGISGNQLKDLRKMFAVSTKGRTEVK